METTFFTFNLWYLIILLVQLLVIIALYILFGKVNALKINPKSNVQTENNTHKTITEINNNSNNNLTNILSRIKKLEDQFAPTPSVVTTAPVQVAPIVVPAPVVYDEKSPEIILPLPEKPKVTAFYMSTPNPDGSFEADQGTDVFRNTVSLYKFTVNANNIAKAIFVFESDAVGISDSLNNPKTFIEPVCYQANDAFPGARQIMTTQQGTAEKRNNKWVVVDKAKIKYQ